MPKDDLAEELEEQSALNFSGGRTNNLSDLACSICAVVASFIAAILAAGMTGYPWLTAGVAALPGMFAALQRVIDFRGRAVWYFVKAAKLKSIAMALRHEGLSPAAASKQFREIEVSMEAQYSQLLRGRKSAENSSPVDL